MDLRITLTGGSCPTGGIDSSRSLGMTASWTVNHLKKSALACERARLTSHRLRHILSPRLGLKRGMESTIDKSSHACSVERDVLALLRRNPGIVDTAKGIALRVYRDPELVRSALAELCRNGRVRVLSAPGRAELFSLMDE